MSVFDTAMRMNLLQYARSFEMRNPPGSLRVKATDTVAFGCFRFPVPFPSVPRYRPLLSSLSSTIFISTERTLTSWQLAPEKKAVPPLDSRNLHRITTELCFLKETLGLQPTDQPKHLCAWVIWLKDLNQKWAEYCGILTSLGFQEAPTGELKGELE